MRELTVTEISQLEERGCWAEDWLNLLVDDDFNPSALSDVTFYGHVELGSLNGVVEVEEGFLRRCCIKNTMLRNVVIGDECLIENIRGYINGYTIGDHCYISNVGVMSAQEGSTFGQGTLIPVLNQGGEGNVVLTQELTAQLCWLMVNFPQVRHLYSANAVDGQILSVVGGGSRIVNTKEITNVCIGESCEISGASRIDNSTILSNEDSSTFIGCDVILENSVVAQGASITDGAKINNSFVGESVRMGKGFTADSSVFFANCHLDNGEANSALCGPFTTSHHKNTLLISGAFSFFNAGSGTSQVNHSYQMGPIHWGMLDRGSKTATDCLIHWPAHIGAFSTVVGKIDNHPQVHKFPFSHIIAEGGKTYLVPGINVKSAGTWRDVTKWMKRDMRPQTSRQDIINFAFPNPYIIQNVLEAKELLRRLIKLQGKDMEEYEYKGCYIKHDALVNGLRYYDILVRLFLWEYFSKDGSEFEEPQGGAWVDMCGMLAPKTDIMRVVEDVDSGNITSLSHLKEVLEQINEDYKRNARGYAQFVIQQEDGSMFIDTDKWLHEAEEARNQWLRLVREDAEEEYQLGDVTEDQLRKFINTIK